MINYIRQKNLLYILNSKHFFDLPKYFECDMFYNVKTKELSFEINNQDIGFMIYVIMEFKKNKYNFTYNLLATATYFRPDQYESMKYFNKDLKNFISVCDKYSYEEVKTLKNFIEGKSYLKLYESLKNMDERQIQSMSMIDMGL